MIDVVEELVEDKDFYILYGSCEKGILYGVYKVIETDHLGFNSHYVKLKLQSAEKKKRYFKNEIVLTGLRIEFSNDKYQIYDDLDDLKKDCCKQLNRDPDKNIKLTKKLKRKYPQYFI